jgi:STE24 endopeptidase
MSNEEFQSNQSYNWHKSLFSLVEISVNFLLIYYLVSNNVYSLIWNHFIKGSNVYWANAKFFVFCISSYKLIELPLNLFKNFYIEKKFGFNQYTLKLFLQDQIKMHLI